MSISTIHFDISPDGRVCSGTLTLCNGVLTKLLDGKEEKFNINDYCEAVQLTDIGCGKLELKPVNASTDGSDNVTVCRFSMSCVGEIGELVKVLNHYYESDELLEMNTDDLPVCPTCHRHYPRGLNVCLFCVKKSYVFSRAFTYFKPYVKSVAFSGILLTIANILGAVMPLFNSILIDHYLVPVENATPYFQSRTTGVIVIALLMSLTFALSKIINVFSSRISVRVGSQFSKDLRELVYGKIQELSLSSMSGKTAGNLIHRVTRDTERVKEFFTLELVKELSKTRYTKRFNCKVA